MARQYTRDLVIAERTAAKAKNNRMQAHPVELTDANIPISFAPSRLFALFAFSFWFGALHP
jgi:hypothetical protein